MVMWLHCFEEEGREGVCVAEQNCSPLLGVRKGGWVGTKCTFQGQVSVTYSLQLTSPPTVSSTSQLLINLWTVQWD